MTSWVIGGAAGQGIMKTALLFAKALARLGYRVASNIEYPSLIRGGHNWATLRFDSDITCHENAADVVVALNEETIQKHKKKLGKDGVLIESRNLDIGDLPKLMINTACVGASVYVLDLDVKVFKKLISEVFSHKSKQIIKQNLKAFEIGYNHAKSKLKQYPATKPTKKTKRLVIDGNTAFALGAIKSGCKFMSAYPMTPASSIMHYMAAKSREHNLVMVHTEDELAAINMAIGAAFSGVRSMTATSGGGFSLMVEGLGLAAMSETPLVVVDSQRPGPSTGLPTRTSQGDLRFVMHASQDDFARIVISPGDVTECFYEGFNAFNLAEKYQMPVIVLLDKQISSSLVSCVPFDVKGLKIDRGKLISKDGKNYKRHTLTKDGVSPRILPGTKNGIYCSSGNEHNEYGNLSETIEDRNSQMGKRFSKLRRVLRDIKGVKMHGPSAAKITLIGFGSTKGAILEAMKLWNKTHRKKIKFMQILYPMPLQTAKVAKILKSSRKTICIECNYTAQLKGVIEQETLIPITHSIAKYDGRPFVAQELLNRLRKLIK